MPNRHTFFIGLFVVKEDDLSTLIANHCLVNACVTFTYVHLELASYQYPIKSLLTHAVSRRNKLQTFVISLLLFCTNFLSKNIRLREKNLVRHGCNNKHL